MFTPAALTTPRTDGSVRSAQCTGGGSRQYCSPAALAVDGVQLRPRCGDGRHGRRRPAGALVGRRRRPSRGDDRRRPPASPRRRPRAPATHRRRRSPRTTRRSDHGRRAHRRARRRPRRPSRRSTSRRTPCSTCAPARCSRPSAPTRQLPVGSLMKLLTAKVAYNAGEPTRVVTVPDHLLLDPEESNIGLDPGRGVPARRADQGDAHRQRQRRGPRPGPRHRRRRGRLRRADEHRRRATSVSATRTPSTSPGSTPRGSTRRRWT